MADWAIVVVSIGGPTLGALVVWALRRLNPITWAGGLIYGQWKRATAEAVTPMIEQLQGELVSAVEVGESRHNLIITRLADGDLKFARIEGMLEGHIRLTLSNGNRHDDPPPERPPDDPSVTNPPP